VEDIHILPIFNSLTGFEESKVATAIKANNTNILKVEKSSVIKDPTGPVRKKDGVPKAKIQHQNRKCLLEGEVVVCTATSSDRPPVSIIKHSHNKPPKATSSRASKAKGQGQEDTKKIRENLSNKTEECKQTGSKRKSEKTTIPKAKRNKNQSEFSQENFTKPQSSLGMHLLESVQVFHALGKKTDKNIGPSSCRALGNSSNTKGSQYSPAIKSQLRIPHEGKEPRKIQFKAQNKNSSAGKECPSPSQYELPPPGKVKLVPLAFPRLDKPQPQPVSCRPQSLASCRPSASYPVRPHSNTAQSKAVNVSQPASANTSSIGPVKPAQPISTNTTLRGLTKLIQPNTSQSAAARPAPYKTSSSTFFQWEPASTAVTKIQRPPKLQTQFLLHDFSLQPIPWRKPNVPEPVMSSPITKEQRPEREAMKRKAQQDREHAAKYPFLGKLQFFIGREKELEISQYYGYVM
jgi:hypothetical protein